MKEEIISIKKDFINEFPQIYTKPSKINKYLKKEFDSGLHALEINISK